MEGAAHEVVALSPSAFGAGKLKRDVTLRGLLLISLGSIIGSGWLLGALTAAQTAGPASSVSWILAGAILAVLALVHAELGSTYPVSGGTARFPFLAFGALGGFTGSWMAWVQAVTIAPIEVEASLGYLDSTSLNPGFVNTNGTLTGTGIAVGCAFMLLFTVINVMGVRWLAETNSIATVWKLLIPTVTIVALIIARFHAGNFTAGGGFAPDGAHGIFAALPVGVVFALQGFEQAIQVGGESRNPQRDIHRAVIISMIIGTVVYLLLEVAFIGAIEPGNVVHNWLHPIGKGNFGPYASLATSAGLGWLATLLYIDAVISPGGTGLLYVGTSSRLSYGLGRNGYLPPWLGQISARGVPMISIVFCFVIGLLMFLPFPSWAGLVTLVTSATVLMYAMAPPSLAALRRTDPDRPRPYRLPFANVLAPLSFVFANFVVYWSGWQTIFWLYLMIIFGYIVFAIYQRRAARGTRLSLNWRSAAWIPPWLIGLGLISYLGQFPSKSTAPSSWTFGVVLLAKQAIPFWWDLVVIAAFSLAVYYMAVRYSQPIHCVQEAVAAAEEEMLIEERELGAVPA
jgi:amino acid transporter